MTDIKTIPLDELFKDRADSEHDIRVCFLALAAGVTHHRDGMTVQYRLDANRKIIEAIDEEIARRKQETTS